MPEGFPAEGPQGRTYVSAPQGLSKARTDKFRARFFFRIRLYPSSTPAARNASASSRNTAISFHTYFTHRS